MQFLSSEVEHLLSAAPEGLPLLQTSLQPLAEARRIHSHDSATLFPGARYSQAALAGLLLRAGYWTESHNVAQEIDSPEGSYWHGVIHRIEPDSFNAGYWFRRVGKHAIFPELFRKATQILEKNGPRHWHLKSTWDAFLFIEWCDEAREKGGQTATTAVEIQTAEWQLLFDWCRTARS
jgi:hypothetical protein